MGLTMMSLYLIVIEVKESLNLPINQNSMKKLVFLGQRMELVDEWMGCLKW